MNASDTIEPQLSDNDLGTGLRVHTPFPDRPPLFIEPAEGTRFDQASFFEWVEAKREEIDRLVLEYGGIVLRGFPLATTNDFNRLMEMFPAYERGYQGGASPRRQLASRALESTVLERHFKIPVHSEMAYLPEYPPRITFFCRVAPTSGGETIIADARRITARLPASVKELLRSKRVRHVRNYAAAGADMTEAQGNPDKLPWDHALGTSSRAEAEANCAALGMEAVWNADGSLTTVCHVDAFAVHPATGEAVYRSTIHSGGRLAGAAMSSEGQALPTGTTFDDGSYLTDEQVAAIRSAVDEATVGFPWQPGDVMFLDNLLVYHGRNPFEGDREIQVSLLG